MKKLRGVVMCGGQSKRMGTDKGLIMLHNSCWASHMANKLSAINLPVSISINISQQSDYGKLFLAEQLITDALNIAGPLNGLLSAHLKYPKDDLLLLACDMISMQTKTISRLVAAYHTEHDYDFYVYQNEDYAEPFCGIYTARGLNDLIIRMSTSNQPNFSMQKVLNSGYTKRLHIIEESSFENKNTPF